jgi:DNA repair photolyase
MDRVQGRGASFNPGNRFEQLRIDDLDEDREVQEDPRRIATTFYHDTTRSIFAKNDSPDVPFVFSVNPYRGCEHGCIYCYARPTHEYLGFSAGLDFESKIMVKMNAPLLLDHALRKPAFEPQVISLSGNTDCYQPIERKLKLTRACLEVFLKYRNPVGIVTKSAMITRDIDILQELAKFRCIAVSMSITTLDPKVAARMEPRAPTPVKRLEALQQLADAGIPVGVNAAPIVPGLTDEELPEIVRAAAERGAKSAAYILMRLPYAVKDLFVEWVNREFPLRAQKILNRIRNLRAGNLSDPRFHTRMTGEGEFANTIAQLFEAACRKYGLNDDVEAKLSTRNFLRPGQISLFNSKATINTEK